LSRRWSRGSEIGAEFACALAAKDPSRLVDLLHPEIDRRWFEDSDDIEALEGPESDAGQIEWMRVLCSGFRERDPQVP
jgi:hypothetical protein